MAAIISFAVTAAKQRNSRWLSLWHYLVIRPRPPQWVLHLLYIFLLSGPLQDEGLLPMISSHFYREFGGPILCPWIFLVWPSTESLVFPYFIYRLLVAILLIKRTVYLLSKGAGIEKSEKKIFTTKSGVVVMPRCLNLEHVGWLQKDTVRKQRIQMSKMLIHEVCRN